MATTKCRHQRIKPRYEFQQKEFVSKNKVSFAGMATTKCRHQRIKPRYEFQQKEFISKNKVSFAGMAKLVDALDLGSSGATHKSSSLFTRTIRLCCRKAAIEPPRKH